MPNNNLRSSVLRIASWAIFWILISWQGYAQVSHKVTVSNNTFNPSQLTIQEGDTVIWQNMAGSHNVNGTQATFPSNRESFGNNVGEDWVYKYVFTKSGTYDYQCDPHAHLGMVGKVIVQDSPSEDGKITIQFTGMTPHIGQEFTAYLKDAVTKDYLDTVRLSAISSADFDVIFSDIVSGMSYEVDFYADLNGNESYDAPPSDHAWRLAVNDVQGDVVLDFVHNTSFTDIFAVVTGLETYEGTGVLLAYPNPVIDIVRIALPGDFKGPVLLNLYHSSGTLLRQEVIPPSVESHLLDVSYLSQGSYLIEALSGNSKEVVHLVKQ